MCCIPVQTICLAGVGTLGPVKAVLSSEHPRRHIPRRRSYRPTPVSAQVTVSGVRSSPASAARSTATASSRPATPPSAPRPGMWAGMSGRAEQGGPVLPLALIAVAGCLAASTACTAPHTSASQPTPSHPTTSAAPTETVSDISVDVAPQIPDEGIHLASVASQQGSRTVPLSGNFPAGPVALMVSCQGRGKLSLDVATVTGLQLPCTSVATGTYNVINFKTKHAAMSIEVRTDPQTKWSLSVGSVKEPIGQ